jgi:isopentenyl diphosphate isomerase/L-lactate dehydrogenase-like FMN-dependent dehydrogenase
MTASVAMEDAALDRPAASARQPKWRRRAINVAALREEARRALPRAVFDFVDGGADDEATLRRNVSAFDDYQFLPRPIGGAASCDTSVTLFGKRLSLPLMVAPTGLAGLIWPDGEKASARAATAAGTAYCVSHASVCTLEELAATGAAPRWMQTYIYKDRELTREIADRAKAAGYDALVVTVDTQRVGNRERDVVNGFTIPPRLAAGEVARMAFKLPWILRMRREIPKITFGNYRRPGSGEDLTALATRMLTLPDPAFAWRDFEWLRGVWEGPLVLKGILHPGDAAEAVANGVDGMMVSNHGGRQLDGAAAALDALPGVAEAVDGRAVVLLDGGVRRGSHVLKALALGADCCLIGRPQLWGLAAGGEAGVAHALDIFRREIELAMSLCGAATVADIGPHLLLPKGDRRRE